MISALNARILDLKEQNDRLVSETDTADMLPPEVDARLEEIARTIQDLHALNRRIWDMMPVLEAAMIAPEK